jgi:hypothetical protein
MLTNIHQINLATPNGVVFGAVGDLLLDSSFRVWLKTTPPNSADGWVVQATNPAPPNANYRIKNGTTFQLYNVTTSKWHSVWLTGAAGEAKLEHELTGES